MESATIADSVFGPVYRLIEQAGGWEGQGN